MRRGVSTNLALAAGATRATFHVEVAVKNAGSPSAKIDFSLFGAGDVTGLDTRVVSRAWPRPGARGAEPNYFPLIEFSHADLPWRYSPAPGDGSRVLPWLCLVVLRKGEVNFTPPIPGGKLGLLNVAVSALPNLSQSWAWAHTQFSGTESLDPNSLAGRVDSEPERFLSRILAPATPGLLQPDTEYIAFLVPTFERGRLAGLGQNPAAILATAPAWTAGAAGSIALPVFYQWGFHTGPQGDFKSLVEKLRPHPLPETVGGRAMDVATPGFGLPAAADTPLFVEGALRSPAFLATGSVLANFIQQLRDLLNLPAQLLQASAANLIVAPPLYGRWHAVQTEVDAGVATVVFRFEFRSAPARCRRRRDNRGPERTTELARERLGAGRFRARREPGVALETIWSPHRQPAARAKFSSRLTTPRSCASHWRWPRPSLRASPAAPSRCEN